MDHVESRSWNRHPLVDVVVHRSALISSLVVLSIDSCPGASLWLWLRLRASTQGRDADWYGTFPRTMHQDFPFVILLLRGSAWSHRRPLRLQPLVMAQWKSR